MEAPRGTSDPPRCDFEATFELLGQKHVLLILRSLIEHSPRRFNEMQESLHVNTATLSDRLKRLERLGIIRRRVLPVTPRRVEYSLTPMGVDLLKIFRTMMAWGQKYSVRTEPARISPGGARRSRAGRS